MTYTDEEIRHLAVSLLTAKTDRDRQIRVGASNLSNQCDRCLAFNIIGQERTSPLMDRPWLGRVLGTAFHGILESRVNAARAAGTAHLIGLHPAAQAERHVDFHEFEHYGRVGGTIDLDLGDHIIDWKGSTRKRIAVLSDYLAFQRGEEPPFGRKHANVKLSEREYDDELAKMAYKVAGYYGQANCYMRGSGAERASLVMIARDGTGYFDNPELDGYVDPKRAHDVFVLSFDYDAAYTDWLLDRAQRIINHLHAGGSPADFEGHALCFFCQKSEEQNVPAVDAQLAVAA